MWTNASHPTRADLIGSRVLLFADFSKLLICKSIPGAAWDADRRAWSYPAIPQIARRIKAAFPNAQLSRGVLALADRQAAVQSTPAVAISAAPLPPQPPAAIQTIPNLKTRSWNHQSLAYQFLQSVLAPTGGAAMLAMGMGTGKTLTTTGVMCNMLAEDEQAIVICPLRVVDVWSGEIAKHAAIPIHVLPLGDDTGTVTKKMEKAAEAVELARLRKVRLVIIINYESLWRDPFARWALAQKWGMVICDESHRIKKPGGKASMFCGRLRTRAKYRLALTGTPMPHSMLDVYGQFRFLDDRIFGRSYHAFKQRFAVMGGFQQKQIVGFRNQEELQALMKKITFRVGKDVLDLPPETHVTYHCDLGSEGARVYRQLEKGFVAEVMGGIITAANAMVKVLRLQQITGGSIRLDDDERYTRIDDAKQKLLADVLEDICAEQIDGFESSREAVVVFCRFRSDLDAVHQAAADLGYSSLELSGRRDDLKDWQNGKGQILAVQISAGGVGINLTRARYSIYYSLSRSLGEYDQSLSRIHRPGQTRPVTHIHLVARGTVDQKIIYALEQRAEVIESILKQIKEQV